MLRKLTLKRNSNRSSKMTKDRGPRNRKDSIFRKKGVRDTAPTSPSAIAPAITMTLSQEDEANEVLTIQSPRIRKISSLVLAQETSLLPDEPEKDVEQIVYRPISFDGEASSKDENKENKELLSQIDNLTVTLSSKDNELIEKQKEIVKMQIVLRHLRQRVTQQDKELTESRDREVQFERELSRSLSKLSLTTMELDQCRETLTDTKQELSVTGSMLVQTQHALHVHESKSNFWPMLKSHFGRASVSAGNDECLMRGYFENP